MPRARPSLPALLLCAVLLPLLCRCTHTWSWMGFSHSRTTPVVIETSLGAIEVELEPDRAPITVENFLRYVDAGYYDNGQFHRTVTMKNQPDDKVKIETIQAGLSAARQALSFPPIPLERTTITGLTHRNGTLSMARESPDSAVADFFICVGHQPSLDFGGARHPDGQGFAAFGYVTGGMDVVRKIHQAAATGQALSPPVRILRIRRVDRGLM